MAHSLLFEIGCEEIPARFLPDALRQLEQGARDGLATLRLGYKAMRVVGGPRRLALMVDGLAAVQADKVKEVKGPSERAAYDAEGNPTRAVEGFARSQGVSLDALEVRETSQGRYVFALLRETGRPAADVLGPWLAELIGRLQFPKSMRWTVGRVRFARPIRWLVALLDDDVIPVEYAGLTSSRWSQGHRLLAPGKVEISHPGAYVDQLRAASVLVDPDERRASIWEQAQAAARALDGRVEENPALLEELTHLVEWPSALTGQFQADYLDLPQEVLVTAMEAHQRYFPVVGPDGRLLPYFITISNGSPDRASVIVKGNEKVLAARLADARFFFEEDRRLTLEEWLPRLGDVVFQETLGTMQQKAERLQTMSRELASEWGLEPDEQRWAERAARLAKADLVTKMVGEFPELAGVMGREYARAGGEDEAVAQAIFDHILPRFAGDRLPATPAGAVVAVVDRLDTLCGCFAAGLIPTGSQDPYALRRAAAGAVHIVRHRGWDVDLADVLPRILALYARAGVGTDAVGEPDTVEQVASFLRQRLRGTLIDEGCRPDVVDAALAVLPHRPVAAARRARGLQDQVGSTTMAEVLRVYQRVANLARQAEGGREKVDASLLGHPAEQALVVALREAEVGVGRALAAGDVGLSLTHLARLGPAVDGFFDGVLVMDPDAQVRGQRLAILAWAAGLFHRLADWSRVEG